MDKDQPVQMELKNCVPVTTYFGDKTNARSYRWASGLLDSGNPFSLQLVLDIYRADRIIPEMDIMSSLNLFPKNREDMPNDAIILRNNSIMGFGIKQNLNADNTSQWLDFTEMANGQILSKEIRYAESEQKKLKSRLADLGWDFPFAQEMYRLLKKSNTIPYGSEHERLYEKHKRAALKRFEKYVLK